MNKTFNQINGKNILLLQGAIVPFFKRFVADLEAVESVTLIF